MLAEASHFAGWEGVRAELCRRGVCLFLRRLILLPGSDVSSNHRRSIRVRVGVSALAPPPCLLFRMSFRCRLGQTLSNLCQHVRDLRTPTGPSPLNSPIVQAELFSQISCCTLSRDGVRRSYWHLKAFPQGQTCFPGSSEGAMGVSWPRRQSTRVMRCRRQGRGRIAAQTLSMPISPPSQS